MSGSRKGTDSKRRTRECVLVDMRDAISSFAKDFPPFGPELGQMSGRRAADLVVCHRIVNKFEIPEAAQAETRRITSIREAISRDEANAEFTFVSNDYTRMARARLSTWFHKFKKTYAFVPPSGASARPNGRDHDVFVKLDNVDNWEISPELIDYAFNIVWNNHSLKKIVRAKFRERYPYLEMCQEFRLRNPGASGYDLFKCQFKSLLTINSVSRMETVPKNNSDDRVITCEPLWNMICQLSYMRDMRNHMRNNWGYDINTRADLHKQWIAHADRCTIDLKAASDLVTMKLIERVWPESMLVDLAKLRPKVLEFKGENTVEYHRLHMFAPMGTGVTFDVMSFTLLALLRFDRSASVFGDDIILNNASYDEACVVLKHHGLIVNHSKSFKGGLFRESCGGMHHDEIGYITSYDVKYPGDICDVITIANKLSLILQAEQISFELQGIILAARNALVSTLPRVVFADKELELSSECVTGFTVRLPHTLHETFERVWHRGCSFHNALVKVAKRSEHKLSKEVAYARFLYAGSGHPTLKQDTVIVTRTIETWSNTNTRDVLFPPNLG